MKVIEKLMSLSGCTQIENKKRLYNEFGAGEKDEESHEANRPADWKQIFDGNMDDCFRIGIKLTRKSMKLYSEFYSSDIIIASTLGLRMIIGAEGYF